MAGSQDEFLSTQKILHLGTVGPDGTPHVVPVWYMYESGTLHIGTNTRTKKARNIMKNKRVSFCVDTGVNAPDICGVMGQGDARLICGKEIKAVAERILARYYDSIENPAAQKLLKDTDCIIEISPDSSNSTTMWRY